MLPVYYLNEKKGLSPVKEFLIPYKGSKKKILAFFTAIVELICEKNNIPPLGIMAGPVKGYSLSKIRLKKDSHTLIRIIYFCYQDTLILLHGFEKPAHYSSEKDKKKYSENQYKIADNYRKKFINNPKLYEKFE